MRYPKKELWFVELRRLVRDASRAAHHLRELGDPRGSLARGLLDSLLVDLDRESGGAEA